MSIMEEMERKFYDTNLEKLQKKLAEKERKRPYGVRKKHWKKK